MAPVIQPKGSFQILNAEKQQRFQLKKVSDAINHENPLLPFFLIARIYCCTINTIGQIMDLAQNNKTFNNFYEGTSLDFYCMTNSPGIQQYNNSMHGNTNIISNPVKFKIVYLTFMIERNH